MKVDTRKCMFCGCCQSVCPRNALRVYDYEVEVTSLCNDCGICPAACPVGCITVEKVRQ